MLSCRCLRRLTAAPFQRALRQHAPRRSCATNTEKREETTKADVLNASLPFVHEHGWSISALQAGAESLGLPATAHGLFARGAVELVFHFITTSNTRLNDELQQQLDQLPESEKIKVGEFIRNALRSRLEMIEPYSENWHQAMALQALPQNSLDSWRHLLSMCDDVWFLAGDRSTDMNWYSKRLSLAVVYKSTEISLLTSSDRQKTWGFLDRRLTDVHSAGNLFKNISELCLNSQSNANAVFELARNMLGANSRR